MSVDPETGFKLFETYPALNPKYPAPSENAQEIGKVGSFPTNSWIQQPILGEKSGFSAVPWQYSIQPTGIGMSYFGPSLPTIITTTNGNLQQIQNIQGVPTFVFQGDNAENWNISSLDDFTSKIDFGGVTGPSLSTTICRGSPFATFPVAPGGNYTIRAEKGIYTAKQVAPGVVEVVMGSTGGSVYETFTNAGFDGRWGQNGALQRSLETLFFHKGTEPTEHNVVSNFSYSAGINYNPFTGTGVPPSPVNFYVEALDVEVRYEWDSGKFTITPEGGAQASVSSDRLTININFGEQPDGNTYEISTNLGWNQTPPVMTAKLSYQAPEKYIFFGVKSFTPFPSFGTREFHFVADENGLFRVANADVPYEKLSPYAQTYITSGETTSFYRDGSFFVNFTNNRGNDWSAPGLIILPNHWKDYTFQETQLRKATGFPVVKNIIYGDLEYYEILQGKIEFIPPTEYIPRAPVSLDGAMWDNSAKNLLAQQIETDAAFLGSPQRNFLPDSDPYAFGQVASVLGRLLLFAKALGMQVDPENPSGSAINGAASLLKENLIKWMTNKNTTGGEYKPGGCDTGTLPLNEVFQIQREKTWGGVIVPADYLLSVKPDCYRLGSFGNSFYNDHHFHWGYMLYAIYCLEYAGDNTLSTNYPKQITALIKDIVNPVSDTFSWKTRHKDWYTGHSWATGVVNAPERQQESCSEAINGYYAAYLMAGVLGVEDLEACASSCLYSEMAACKNYYYLQAPGSKLGDMKNVKGAGIIFNDSKQFTLDWRMQPDSFPGRALGIYGIQCVPFTDIAPYQIPPEWATSLPVPSEDPKIGLGYSITPNLVGNLCADAPTGVYTPIGVYNTEWFKEIPFDVEQQGVFWGFVGLKMLAFGSGISNSAARTAYTQALNKQQKFKDPNGLYFPITKQFDSFSNTLYWLVKQGKWQTSGAAALVFREEFKIPLLIIEPPASDDCSRIKVPTKKELLEQSDIRNQGLVEVPTIIIKACFDDALTNIDLVRFQIRDEFSYEIKRKEPSTCPGCFVREKGKCLIKGICAEDVVISQLKTNLDITTMIDAPGNTLYEKINYLPQVDPILMILYAYLKIILARAMYGNFSLTYLSQSFNEKFFEDLSKSRFCRFIEPFVELDILDYNMYFL